MTYSVMNFFLWFNVQVLILTLKPELEVLFTHTLKVRKGKLINIYYSILAVVHYSTATMCNS